MPNKITRHKRFRLASVWASQINKQADVVGCMSAPLVSDQPHIFFRTKQEHNLLKVLSFSQSKKYVMVAIFRQLSSSILRLLQPSLSLLSVSFILSPSTSNSLLLSPHFINRLSTTSWPCCLTSTLAIPAVPEPETLHQKALLPAETMFHTISSVNWAGNISVSHVHIWAWTDLCEKNGSSLDEFTCETLHWESDGSQAVGKMCTVQCCRSGFNL